ncbi:MAG: DnaA ATPase domain-containing protein, partial [Planctomycetota bacterium]
MGPFTSEPPAAGASQASPSAQSPAADGSATPAMSAAELARWQTVTQYVQAHVKPQQFETWFSRLVCLRITTDHVLIQTPNTFYRNWMEEHYRTLIERATAEITDADPRVTFTIADEPEAAHASASSNHSHPAPAHSPAQAPLAHTKSAAAPISPTLSAGSHTPGQPLARAVGKTLERLGVATSRNEGAKVFPEAGRQEVDGTPPRTMGDLRLNPQYTFEHFVVGPSNRLGHAACLAVTEKPALVYNPLFLHGDVGLVKTHLLQAVCFALLEKSPGLRVAYLSCEAFVNDYISKLQKGQLEIFRERYRHVDLLL